MSEPYQNLSSGASRGSYCSGSAAPTRTRKRVYDSEINNEDDGNVVNRRTGHFRGDHESKPGAPYKKGERLARYCRRPDNCSGGISNALGSSGTHGVDNCDMPKSPMMEDDINVGLADNFDDSLCGLGSDISTSTYNMSEALHALPPVKRETSSPRVEQLTTPVGIMEDSSNSIDKLLKLFTNDNTFDGMPSASITQLIQSVQHHSHPHQQILSEVSNSNNFNPLPCEDAISPPSPTQNFSQQSRDASSMLHHHSNFDQHFGLNNAADYHHLQNYHNNPQVSKTSSPELEEGDHGPNMSILPSSSNIVVEEGLITDFVPSDEGCDENQANRLLELRLRGMDEDSGSKKINYHDPLNCDLKNSLALGFDDIRFQYILSVPTSTAVKKTEHSLSYLNQGQPYEIKIKKLGDITKVNGRRFTTKLRLCFHERRFQYNEKEQLIQWHQLRPNEKLIEIDVPLSYGITDVQQCKGKAPVVQFDWDPTKEVAVFIKVHCISTEFTQRKHGGEKGVPFRIQAETYTAINDQLERLFVCGCQIKVFKLKGADRKHKQDKDKINKLPLCEKDKYQESCDCTIFNTYAGDMIYGDQWLDIEAPCAEGALSPRSSNVSTANASPVEQRKLGLPGESGVTDHDSPELQTRVFQVTSGFAGCSSSTTTALDGDETALQLQEWLTAHRFSQNASTFANFTATDILRLSRDELIQICGLADGIRLFNDLHARSCVPHLTLYVCREGDILYSALYLERATHREFLRKLCSVFGISTSCVRDVLFLGPSGIHFKLSDEVVRNFQNDTVLSCCFLSSSGNSSSDRVVVSDLTPGSSPVTLLLKVQQLHGQKPADLASSPTCQTSSNSMATMQSIQKRLTFTSSPSATTPPGTQSVGHSPLLFVSSSSNLGHAASFYQQCATSSGGAASSTSQVFGGNEQVSLKAVRTHSSPNDCSQKNGLGRGGGNGAVAQQINVSPITSHSQTFLSDVTLSSSRLLPRIPHSSSMLRSTGGMPSYTTVDSNSLTAHEEAGGGGGPFVTAVSSNNCF